MITALLLAGTFSSAQKATEQYIPIGESPGISGEYSYIGKIDRVDGERRTFVMVGAKGPRTIKITDETRIWLDRTERRRSCTVGGVGDLQPGRRVEVHYADYDTRDTAAWIKIAP